MFYILERKEKEKFDQLGIVVADSIELAAAKIEMKIMDSIKPPESAIEFVALENGYMLSEMPEITSSASIPKPKSTAKLMYIANTSLDMRQEVMPRIECVDGVTLSVQASFHHYSIPMSAIGPFRALEVAFLSGTDYPVHWDCVESHSSAVLKHDHKGINLEAMNNCFPVYTVSVEELKKFIEDHGGEKQ